MSALYRALLRLYPASFRTTYGAELVRTFEESVQDRGEAAALLAAISDVVPNAIALHAEMLRQDVRYALRTLNRSRGFAVAAVLVTALGVGANTATFSVADYVLLRPLPYPESNRPIRLCEVPRSGGGWGCNNQMSPAGYRDIASVQSIENFGVFGRGSFNLVGSDEPLRITIAAFTSEVFPVLGVTPLIGRTFDPARTSDVDRRSVVLSYALWQSQFGSDERILGRTLRLDGEPYVVIGVMPQTFQFPDKEVQLWTALSFREEDYADRDNNYLEGIGRLAPNVTFEQARTELNALVARLARDFPATNAERSLSLFGVRDDMSPRYKLMLYALCGASLCLLLLTCANLINLLLARAAGREHELAVRSALGAGRERLVRQMLTESVLLAMLGGGAGIFMAAVTVPLLAHLIPPTLPVAGEPTLDHRVFAIAIMFSSLTAIGFGLIPALRSGGRDGFGALRAGARGGNQKQRLRGILVSIEVAASVLLLISSGLLIRAMWRVESVDPGFVAGHVQTLRTALPNPAYDNDARRSEFYRRVLAEVATIPGVEYAAYTSGLPMIMTGGIARVGVPGVEPKQDGSQNVSYRLVTSQFFDALRIPLRRGRQFEDSDTPGRNPVAIVSESFVQQYWPGGDPIGRTFVIRAQQRTIVGVVADIKVRGLERTNEPQIYLPAMQPYEGVGGIYVPKDLVIRLSGPGVNVVPAVREIVRRVDPEQPVSHVRMMSDIVGDQTATRRAQLHILGALAVLALLLAGVGIHGLLAFTIAQRSREIGVRLALGAAPSLVARMVVSEATRMALFGVVPGIVGAYFAARAMSALLFGVEPTDPLTFAAAALLCLFTAVMGALRPALRAARIDPMTALRAD